MAKFKIPDGKELTVKTPAGEYITIPAGTVLEGECVEEKPCGNCHMDHHGRTYCRDKDLEIPEVAEEKCASCCVAMYYGHGHDKPPELIINGCDCVKYGGGIHPVHSTPEPIEEINHKLLGWTDHDSIHLLLKAKINELVGAINKIHERNS